MSVESRVPKDLCLIRILDLDLYLTRVCCHVRNHISPISHVRRHNRTRSQTQTSTNEAKRSRSSRISQPTSPHEFHQVPVLDVVGKVADIDAVLALRHLGELDGLLVGRVHRATQRAREGVGRTPVAAA